MIPAAVSRIRKDTHSEFLLLVKLGQLPWKTRSGEIKRLWQLDCGHLKNISNLLRRKLPRLEFLWQDALATECIYDQGPAGEREAFDELQAVRDYIDLLSYYIRLREAHGFYIEGPEK